VYGKVFIGLYEVRTEEMEDIISYSQCDFTDTDNSAMVSEKLREFLEHGIALGYGLDDWGSRVRFLAELGIFLFTTASRTALGPTQPPIQWLPGALSLG
jgi:hypothetical protein